MIGTRIERRPPSAAAATPWTAAALALAVLVPVLDGPAVDAAPAPQVRGELDGDGARTVADATRLLNFLFLRGSRPPCDAVADTNDDGSVDLSDAVYLLLFLFAGGEEPAQLDEADLVLCTNAIPSVPLLPVYRTYPGFPMELGIGATDPDGDALHYEAVDFPAGATIDPETGVVRWTPAADQLGPFYLRFAVSDDRSPPAEAHGLLTARVAPLDPCVEPDCSPATGCRAALKPLGATCCGEPGARVPEPVAGCPGGKVAYVGRNFFGFGRLQSCDRVRLVPLSQGGVVVFLNVEARCLNTDLPISILGHLETAEEELFPDGQEIVRPFTARDDGFAEAIGVDFITDPISGDRGRFEGSEANLRVMLTDVDGEVAVTELRVVLTFERLDDLPETP